MPLRPGDGFVPLDLQQVVARCYETGPYHRRIRYGESPVEPALGKDYEKWATNLLAAKK